MKLSAKAVVVSFLLVGVCFGQDQPPKLTDNAALQYWFAFYLMYQDDKPSKAAEFVSRELVQGRVPATEALKPGIAEICRKNETAVTRYLRTAAGMSRCDFGLDYSRGLLLPLPHLSKARELARQAVAYGKLLEAEGQPLKAAEVYCDVIQMGPQFAQDNLLVSALVGMAVGHLGDNALRHLLAHEPSAQVCEHALARLAQLPDAYIPIGPRVPFEAKLLGPLLRSALTDEAHFGLTEKDKQALLKEVAENAPAQMKEDIRDKAKMKQRFDGLLKECLSKTEKAAEIMAKPYSEAIPALRDLDKEVKDSPNFLVKMAMPDLPRLFTRTARATANVRATRILAAAALHRAKTGRYPDRLDDLKPYFPKGVPSDPVADKGFSYRLEDGLPCLEGAEPPPGIEGAQPDGGYPSSFARILQMEDTGKRWTAD